MDIGEKVKFYLNRSGDTSYFLQQQTGVIAKAIDNIRRGHADPQNITLKTAFAIISYFQGNHSYEKEILHKLNFVLDSDLTSYKLAHMMIFIDENGHEHFPLISNIDVLRTGKKALPQIRIISVLRLLSIYDKLNSTQKNQRNSEIITHYGHLNKGANQTKEKSKPFYGNDAQLNNKVDIINNVKNELNSYNKQIQNKLLDKIMASNDEVFKYTIVELLSKMGYVGEHGEIIKIKLSNDNKVEGLINQDPLGAIAIYIQAKKYNIDNYVQAHDIQEFRISSESKHASKGVFITTAKFSSEAIKEAKELSVTIVDGHELAKLMFNYHVGIKINEKIEFMKIDNDYFS